MKVGLLFIIPLILLKSIFAYDNSMLWGFASNKTHDPETEICCNNVISKTTDKNSTACCGSKSYNRKTQFCCNDVVYTTSMLPDIECCGTEIYNIKNHICCKNYDGTDMTVVDAKGKATMGGGTRVCCGGEPLNSALSCCGGSPYDPKTQTCCFGRESKNFVTDKTNTHDACCYEYLYNSNNSICCGNSLFDKTENSGCCGDKLIDLTTHGCCDGKVFARENQVCCGGKLFSKGSGVCCESVEFSKFYVGANVTSDVCCEFTLLRPRDIGTEKARCCRADEDGRVKPGCCWLFPYNEEKEECCGPTVIVPKRVHGQSSCCSESTNRDEFYNKIRENINNWN